MTSSSNEQLLRQIIMDHYQHPRNKGLAADNTGYMTVHLTNPSCGDELAVQIKVSDELLESIRQDGSGCSICCASASMMTELLAQEDLETVEEIISQFHCMVQGEEFSEEILGDAICLQGVSHLPQRVKCATLAWQAVERGLEQIAVQRTANPAQEITGEYRAEIEDEDEDA